MVGFVSRRILASLRLEPAFVWLHGMHALTTFSHTCLPLRERGMMWSSVNCLDFFPQYWQVNPSR